MAPLRIRVPYPTIVALERVLPLLVGAPPRIEIDRKFLLDCGIPSASTAPVLEALRFLDLLDERDRVTPGCERFVGDPAPIARARLEPILHLVRPPYPDRKALARDLEPYLDATRHTLPLSATFLDWLAQQARIPLVVRTRPKPGARAGVPRPQRASERRSRRRPPAAAGAAIPPAPAAATGLAAAPGLAPAPASSQPDVNFQLVIDRNTSPEDIDRMVNSVREALARLRAETPRGSA